MESAMRVLVTLCLVFLSVATHLVAVDATRCGGGCPSPKPKPPCSSPPRSSSSPPPCHRKPPCSSPPKSPSPCNRSPSPCSSCSSCSKPPTTPSPSPIPPSTPSTPSLPDAPTTPMTPMTPSTPTAPVVPMTPMNPLAPFFSHPFTAPLEFWLSHPELLGQILGYMGSIGSLFGSPSFTSIFGFIPTIPQALSSTREDGYGALLREGTAALLNSVANQSLYPYSTSQVQRSFMGALVSEAAAAAQAGVFKAANEGRGH